MSLQKALDAALETVPQCNIVCYVDIGSSLVLRKAVSSPVAQEILDRCAGVASCLWGAKSHPQYMDALKEQSDSDASSIYVLKGPRHTYVFARSTKYEDHAICFRCTEDCRPSALIEATKDVIGVITDAY